MANIKRANTSGITKSGAAISDVPDAPTIGAVTNTAAGGTVTVAYTAATTGGAVTTFTATSTPGTITGTGASPITVSGLTDSTAYTFKVKGTNSTATGPESAASSSVTPTSFLVGAYDSIATTTLSATTASITFSSIPSTYTHLQIRGISKTSAGTGNEWIAIGINSSSPNLLSQHIVYGDGATANGENGTGSTTQSSWFALGSANDTASAFGVSIMDILDYTNTNKYKTLRTIAGWDKNGSGFIGFSSNLWNSTSAITSITLLPRTNSFIQYTSFALYGIKGV